MMKSIQASKLTELRQRTDRDLLALLKKDLERALALARVAATTKSPFYEQAASIYEKLGRLLPGLSVGEAREQLAPKLKELELALDQVAPATVQRQIVCGTTAR